MNTPVNRGARLQAFTNQASVDLARLIEVLIPAISVEQSDPQHRDPKKRPFIYFDSQKKRLKLCTSGVLYRFFTSPAFKQAFGAANGDDSGGFVLDFEQPKFGYSAKLGGRLAEGNQTQLPKILDRLLEAIDSISPNDETLSQLLLPDAEAQLEKLGRKLKLNLPDPVQTATVQSVIFQNQNHQSGKSSKAVAKVISALEQVDAKDYFEKMTKAIADHLEQQDYDEDEIEEAQDNLRQERNRGDSQIGRFLSFLENEALSRVRLNISVGIMAEIAAIARQQPSKNNALLVSYIETIVGISELEDSLDVDLSQYFGSNAQFSLNDYLNRSSFYNCLAVWSEAKTQIFEEKIILESGEAIQREISYRFKINGKNPETGKSAFESRLEKIKDYLNTALDPEYSHTISIYTVNRSLAELLFLDSILPWEGKREDDQLSIFDPQQWLKNFQARQAWLSQANGIEIKVKIQDLINDLLERKNVVSNIATALIQVLREKENRLLEQIKTRSSRQFICIDRDIVNWNRLEAEHTSGLLQGQGGGAAEQIEWLKHIEISDHPNPRSLFSVEVNTQLSGYNIVFQDTPPQTIQAQRVFSPQLLQILWVPHEKCKLVDKEDQSYCVYRPIENALKARDWALDAAIQLEYEAQTLQRSPKSKKDPNSGQYHAAAIAAFEVLVYVTLWRIIQRLKKLQSDKGEPEPFTTLVLRLQAQGENIENATSGETYVYGAAQSIETVLNQDIPLRMQGFTLDNLKSATAKYVQEGSFRALLSAFPLRLTTPSLPHLPKLGMITYATRPCDEQPDREASANYNLLVTKSYLATATQSPFSGYEIKAERTNLDILAIADQVGQQRLIKEEIRQLQQQGCEHIILISHSYGGRKLNRTSSRANYLIQTQFLEDIFQNFPELTLYPLVKDEFPTTRLYTTKVKEAGFEINRAEHHTNFLRSPERETVRDLIPVYTFATLNVVGNDSQRPQSGFCSYFLISDRQISNPAWTERARQHLLNADGSSLIHPCLIYLLRGVHFLEAEKLGKNIILPVLNPYSWITPTTKEAAGEVQILDSRRRGTTFLSYPALLSHLSTVLHRKDY